MNRNTFCTIALVVVLILMGACDDNTWSGMPRQLQNFVNEYFPFGEVESCVRQDSGIYVVEIKNGATLQFGSNLNWIDVNGNGMPLPDNFLYDELPDTLYSYLQEMEQTGSVFRVQRNEVEITVNLYDSRVVYDIASNSITYPLPSAS